MPLAVGWARGAEVAMGWMTVEEMLSLFHRSSGDARWLSSADAEEYLAIVTYLVSRDVHGNRNF
jgi:hypothetical protein